MPEVRPFQGIRYTPSELSTLVCPPYDIISEAQQAELRASHPHNAVRLELPEGGSDRYARAAETFTGWLEHGVLQREEERAFYVYRQDFEKDGLRRRVNGVMGALRLEDFGEGSGVWPHERTMAGPKQDRLSLLRALPVNVSPIYAIYRGQRELAPFLGSLEHRPPEARFGIGGVLHRLWVIRAAAEVEMLIDALGENPLVIADGHHRYETALAFHREQSEPGDHDSILCFCVDADAEDLVVLPYHRGLTTTVPADKLEQRLVERFEARAIEGTANGGAGTDGHSFTFVLPTTTLRVHVTSEEVAAALPGHAPAWRALDVVVLHELLFPRLLDGSEEIAFSRDADEIRERVATGSCSAGVLLRGMDAAQVVDVARSGERMPQKASYFWPKALTGLVFRPLR